LVLGKIDFNAADANIKQQLWLSMFNCTSAEHNTVRRTIIDVLSVLAARDDAKKDAVADRLNEVWLQDPEQYSRRRPAGTHCYEGLSGLHPFPASSTSSLETRNRGLL
jgi:hypothetical protein